MQSEDKAGGPAAPAKPPAPKPADPHVAELPAGAKITATPKATGRKPSGEAEAQAAAEAELRRGQK